MFESGDAAAEPGDPTYEVICTIEEETDLNVQSDSTRSIKELLEKYFEMSGEDGNFVVYDLKPGYIAHHKMDSIVAVSISQFWMGAPPNFVQFKMHSEERGSLDATEEAILALNIYRLEQVSGCSNCMNES